MTSGVFEKLHISFVHRCELYNITLAATFIIYFKTFSNINNCFVFLQLMISLLLCLCTVNSSVGTSDITRYKSTDNVTTVLIKR